MFSCPALAAGHLTNRQSNIRNKDFCAPPQSRSCYPPLILKGGGLEISGQRLISSNAKTKSKAYFLSVKLFSFLKIVRYFEEKKWIFVIFFDLFIFNFFFYRFIYFFVHLFIFNIIIFFRRVVCCIFFLDFFDFQNFWPMEFFETFWFFFNVFSFPNY